MSYCRFENTLRDLRDCEENWDDKDMSKEEKKYRARLLAMCEDIVGMYSTNQ